MSTLQSQDPFRTSTRFQQEIERFHLRTFELALDIDTDVFFARPTQGWSVAENYTHITGVCHTMRLIFSPLHNPATWVMGKATDERPDLKEFMKEYHAGLEKGFRSGPFTPAREEAADADSARLRQATILEKWKDSWQPLAENVGRYSDSELISRQFYHPLLGRIPLIEAAYMAIFHSIHHLQKAEKKAGTTLLPPFFLD
jgi:hypothetical protein